MSFSGKDLEAFHGHGFVVQEAMLERQITSLIVAELDALQSTDAESRNMERDGQTPRALHGCHAKSILLNRLIRLPQ